MYQLRHWKDEKTISLLFLFLQYLSVTQLDGETLAHVYAVPRL